MNDIEKEIKLKKYAIGYVSCWIVLLIISVIFGKAYGRLIVLTVIPFYSLFYVFLYRRICKSYEDETKRMLAFGYGTRGTFIGIVYSTSLCLSIVSTLLIAVAFYEA